MRHLIEADLGWYGILVGGTKRNGMLWNEHPDLINCLLERFGYTYADADEMLSMGFKYMVDEMKRAEDLVNSD